MSLLFPHYALQFERQFLQRADQILLQLGDLTLQTLHIHALEGLQAILGGLELGRQAFLLRLDGTDAPAVLVQNSIDDLLGQRLVAHLDVLQEFAFHGCSFLRFALISVVASPAVGVFAPATVKIGMKKASVL